MQIPNKKLARLESNATPVDLSKTTFKPKSIDLTQSKPAGHLEQNVSSDMLC